LKKGIISHEFIDFIEFIFLFVTLWLQMFNTGYLVTSPLPISELPNNQISFYVPSLNFDVNSNHTNVLNQSNDHLNKQDYFQSLLLPQKISIEYLEHERIHISNNSDFIEKAKIENWGGDGTIENPIVIEGLKITDSVELIRISNINVYFQIKFCILDGKKGEFNGISLLNASNGFISNNTVSNTAIGIYLDYNTVNNTISHNLIINSTNNGISTGEDTKYNIFKFNDLIENNNSIFQAKDDGIHNLFVYNYWSDWIQPDVNGDGIIDIPYSIGGASNSSDRYALRTPNPPQNHSLSLPIIICPTSEDVLSGIILIQWLESIDSFGHEVVYSLYFSQDPRGIWKTLVLDLNTTTFLWNTAEVDDTDDHWIRLRISCSESEITEEVLLGPLIVQNVYTPLMRLITSIFLIFIVISILIGAIILRWIGSTREKSILSKKSLIDLEICLCFGSFTDQGLIIQAKNDTCTFDIPLLQSMLEYSAVFSQHGQTDSMYGPYPLKSSMNTGDLNNTDLPKAGWNFVAYWVQIKDPSIEDPRIIRRGGEVPGAFLLFYPKQCDSTIMSQRTDIINILKSALNESSIVTDINDAILNRIEHQILDSF
jgi:parallel beta-helix repeat protein